MWSSFSHSGSNNDPPALTPLFAQGVTPNRVPIALSFHSALGKSKSTPEVNRKSACHCLPMREENAAPPKLRRLVILQGTGE